MPLPIATVVVAHSPTPSAVKTIASSNGDGKKALAAWLKWWSEKNIFHQIYNLDHVLLVY